MRIKTERRRAIVGNKGEAFSITVNDAMFDILSRKLYKNPPVAVIRELVANGFDAGADDVRVYMDSTHRYLRVEDNGCGMAHDTVMELYPTYGESSKRDDDSAFGCYGLGAKSPFAVAPFFRVKTKCEGEDTWREYLCEHTTGVPTIRLVQELPGDKKEHGTIVTVDDAEENVFYPDLLRTDGLAFIANKWKTFYNGEEVSPMKVDTVNIDGDIKFYVKSGTEISSSSTKYFQDHHYIKIITGTGVYEVRLNEIGESLNVHVFNIFGAEACAIEVPVGSVGVTPSKDDLLLNPEDKKYLADAIRRVDAWIKQIYDEVKASCAKYSCFNPDDYELCRWNHRDNSHILPLDVALVLRLSNEGLNVRPGLFCRDRLKEALWKFVVGDTEDIPYVFSRANFPAYASKKRIEDVLFEFGMGDYQYSVVFLDEKEIEKELQYPFLFADNNTFERVMKVYDEGQQEKVIEAVRESYKASRKKKSVPTDYIEYYDLWRDKKKMHISDFEAECPDGVVLVPVKEEKNYSYISDMTDKPVVLMPTPFIRKVKDRGNVDVIDIINVAKTFVLSRFERMYGFLRRYETIIGGEKLPSNLRKKMETLDNIFAYAYRLGGAFVQAEHLAINKAAFDILWSTNDFDLDDFIKQNNKKFREAVDAAYQHVLDVLKNRYGALAKWMLDLILNDAYTAKKIEVAIEKLVEVVPMSKEQAAREVKAMMKKYGAV